MQLGRLQAVLHRPCAVVRRASNIFAATRPPRLQRWAQRWAKVREERAQGGGVRKRKPPG
jgi:hypothetical protein